MQTESSLVSSGQAVRVVGLGVYWIRCLITQKVYIGSSIDVAKRLDQHVAELRSGKHHSIKLQNAWNKYGEDAFDMDLVDPVYIPANLRSAETYYIELYDSYNNGYNCTTMTGQNSTIPPEVKKKMSSSAKLAGRDPELRRLRSERAKAQHATGKLGQACWKPGTSKLVGKKLQGKKRPDVTARMKGNQYARKQ